MTTRVSPRANHGLWLLLSISTLVFSGDTPPQTLPRAFVQQLPLLMELRDDEFEGLLRHVRNEVAVERPPRKREETDHAP